MKIFTELGIQRPFWKVIWKLSFAKIEWNLNILQRQHSMQVIVSSDIFSCQWGPVMHLRNSRHWRIWYSKPLDKFINVYIDDVVIFSKQRESNYNYFEIFLERLWNDQWYAYPEKMYLSKKKLTLLAYLLVQMASRWPLRRFRYYKNGRDRNP